MTDLHLSAQPLSAAKVAAIVVGACSTPTGPSIVGDFLDAGLARELEALAPSLGVTGAPDEVRRVPAGGLIKADVIVLTGLGEREADGTFTRESLRRAAGAAIREMVGVNSAAIGLPHDDEGGLAAIAEGALLGAYAFTQFRSGNQASKQPPPSVVVCTAFARSERAKAGLERAQILSRAVHGTRDLVNTPPNVLYPAAFVDMAKAAIKEAGVKVKVTVLDEKDLVAGGFGGIVGVGQGSSRPPRLVKVAYTPANAVASVGLVGKGITFDTGGLDIKPASGMYTMTMDMAGAATVLHATIAVACLGVPVAVTAYMCIAENMPSGSAQRPGDVVTMRGGKTVEVTNTDAEGRLVLADGMVEATDDGVDVVVSIATLTGAQIQALGHRIAGVMGTDEVRDQVVAAADAAGEDCWPMPMPPELKAGLKSDVADLVNTPTDRAAGMLFAAEFLREFVGTTPWAHIDIAGPAWNDRAPYGYTPKCATGMGVRTLVAFAESQATN